MNSCQKGKRGEREWRDVLQAEGYEARRGRQYSGSPESPDVVSSLPIHFEVKRVERVNLRDVVAQAESDSGGKPWAVAIKWNGGEWFVLQKASDWFGAVRGDYAEPDSDGAKRGNRWVAERSEVKGGETI